MANVTKPIILDETGQRIATALEGMKENGSKLATADNAGLVKPDGTTTIVSEGTISVKDYISSTDTNTLASNTADSVNSNVGYVQHNSVAAQNYAVGDLIMLNQRAYKATQTINQGADIVIGTNTESTPTNVSEEIQLLKSNLVYLSRERRREKKQLNSNEIAAVKSLITNGYFNAPVDIIDGDYFYGASGLKYTLAHYNYFKGSATQSAVIKQNHYALVVDTMSGYTVKWAENDTTAYNACTLRSYLVDTALPTIKTDMAALGFSVLAHSCLEGSTATANGTTEWGWVNNEQIIALSESQVYGGIIAASSFLDEGEANRQLNCFKNFSFMDICDMKYLWLKERSKQASCACRATGDNGVAVGDAGVGAAYAAFGLIIVA